jgi:hypothetical protein
MINLLPPAKGKSIKQRIKIFDFLTSKFSVNSSSQANAMPPVLTR